MAESRKITESDNPRVQAALQEYFQRIDRGERVDVEAFLAAHTEIRSELRSFVTTAEELERLAGQPRGSGANSSTGEKVTHSVAGKDQETMVPLRAIESAVGKPGAEILPERFGRYRILKPLGRGAMGVVFLAEDTQLHRQVALKTPSFEKDETGELLERFYREARAAANLRHANICPVYDIDQIDGTHYISMAYIEGRPLSAFIQPQKRLSERQVLTIIRKLALALQVAHEGGILHRDLKPANVMIDARGEPIIMDFGLARIIQGEDEVRLTQSGTIVGSPAYMSPEQVQGDTSHLGPATDQYSLGVMLYEMLSGQLPFRGSMTAVIGQILTKEPPPLESLRPGLDPRIVSLCMKMMAKSASDRFPSLKAAAGEMGAILRTFGPEAPSGPTTPATGETPVQPKPHSKPRGTSGQSPTKAAEDATESATESSVAALAGAARKCLARHDYEQVIRMLEQIPEERRTDEIRLLLKKARGLADEVMFLLAEIDEAVRQQDGRTALEKARKLKLIAPAHRRAREIETTWRTLGGGKGRGKSPVPRSPGGSPVGEGTGFFWPAVAAGGVVFLVMLAAVVFYLRSGNAVVKVTINDPAVKVSLQGRTLNLESTREPVKVEPGEETLVVRYGEVEFETPKFTLRKGINPAVVVELLDRKLAAKFGQQVLGEWEVPLRESAATVAASTTSSPPNFALEFDGNTSRVEVPGISWDGSPGLTIEAWIDSPLDREHGMLIAWLRGTTACQLIQSGVQRNPPRRWLGQIYGASDRAGVGVHSPDEVAADTGPWHVAIVLDHGQMRLFENGKLLDEKPHARGWGQGTFTPAGLHLGARHDETNDRWFQHFHGKLDEIRISKTARYREDFTPPRRFEPDADTMALFHCDEGKGDVLADSSGNGHHGTVVAAKWIVREEGSPGASSSAPQTGSPRLVRLDELNSPGQDQGAWLSPDGLRIYWEQLPSLNTQEGEIWTAERSEPSAPFQHKRRLLAGRSPALSPDETEIIFVGATKEGRKPLYTARRDTRIDPFGPATELQLGGYTDFVSPMLSADGLKLSVNAKINGEPYQNLIVQRTKRSAPWGLPRVLDIRWDTATERAPLTWIALSPDELWGLATHELEVGQWRVMQLWRPGKSHRFRPAGYLSIPGLGEITGRAPRYFPATRELYLTALPDYAATSNTVAWQTQRSDLWVIRDLDLASPPAPPPSDTIDLLDGVNVGAYSNENTTWTRDGSKLIRTGKSTGKPGWPGLGFPQKIRGDYDFDLEIVVKNVEPFQVNLPLGSTAVTVDLGRGCGFTWIDNKHWSEHPPEQYGTNSVKLERGKVQRFQASVRNHGENVTIEVKINGVVGARYSGARSRLSMPAWSGPDYENFAFNGLGDLGKMYYEVTRAVVKLSAPAASAPDESTADWQPLFNGRDLTGWKASHHPESWSARDGTIVLNSGPPEGWLATERDYSDFELEFEYKLATAGNSGVFLRIPPNGAALKGTELLEIQLIDERGSPIPPQQSQKSGATDQLQSFHKSGAVYRVAGPYRPGEYLANEWHRMKIRAVGTQISVSINGQEVNSIRLEDYPKELAARPALARTSGKIGFQNHGSRAEFRNIRIRELTPAAGTKVESNK